MKQTPRRQTVHTQVFKCKNNTAPAQLRFSFEVIDPEELLHLGLFLKTSHRPRCDRQANLQPPRVFSRTSRAPKAKIEHAAAVGLLCT